MKRGKEVIGKKAGKFRNRTSVIAVLNGLVMKTYIRKIRHKFDNIVDAIDEALILGKKYFLRKDITIS